MKTKIDLSVICCYNDSMQLNNMLLKSYHEQDVECELVLVDNTKNKFNSAAQGLNYGAKQATSNNLIFAHQDIVFLQSDTIKKLYEEIANSNGIIGVAGVKEEEKGVLSSIYHGKEKALAGDKAISEKVEVSSVDECIFGMKKEIYDKVKFDEITCDNWHLYGLDICYGAHEIGIKSYIVPAEIWHVSEGHKNKSFYKTLGNIKKKYKNKRKLIVTCCIRTKTNEPMMCTKAIDYLKTKRFEIKKGE